MLFLNTEGCPLRAATFRKGLRAPSKRLGIELHLTRHSAAKLLIEEDIDIRIPQALLGSASVTTTEIYMRGSNHALRRALE
ncbi:MAG: tyrosine-type recombinase/integrase [Pseudomonadota bacterium]